MPAAISCMMISAKGDSPLWPVKKIGISRYSPLWTIFRGLQFVNQEQIQQSYDNT